MCCYIEPPEGDNVPSTLWVTRKLVLLHMHAADQYNHNNNESYHSEGEQGDSDR